MSTPCYYAKRQRDGSYEVHCSQRGLILEDIDCLGSAQDHIADLEAADAEGLAAEVAECDALASEINARGGYVAPDDHAGHGRGRAIDAVLGFIDAHKASLAKAHAAATARVA